MERAKTIGFEGRKVNIKSCHCIRSMLFQSIRTRQSSWYTILQQITHDTGFFRVPRHFVHGGWSGYVWH